MYRGSDEDKLTVSSFQFKADLDDLETPSALGSGRLYYKNGWTGVILWDGESYFADGIYCFDEMIDLVRTRYRKNWGFEIHREYPECEE